MLRMWLPTKQQRVSLLVADKICQPLWQVTNQFGGSFWISTWLLEHWWVGFAFEDTNMGTKKNNTGVFPLCWCHSRILFVLQFNLPLWERKHIVVEMRKLLCSLILFLSVRPSGNKLSLPLNWNLSPKSRTFRIIFFSNLVMILIYLP